MVGKVKAWGEEVSMSGLRIEFVVIDCATPNQDGL